MIDILITDHIPEITERLCFMKQKFAPIVSVFHADIVTLERVHLFTASHLEQERAASISDDIKKFEAEFCCEVVYSFRHLIFLFSASMA